MISDKITQKLSLHLSQNECHHIFKETPEEGLLQKYAELIVNTKEDQCIPENPKSMKGITAQQYQIQLMDYSRDMLRIMINIGSHYVHALDFKLNNFHADMMFPYGGVSLSIFEYSNETKIFLRYLLSHLFNLNNNFKYVSTCSTSP